MGNDLLINDNGLIRKIAVICKDYYTLSTIEDLFIYAGSDESWCVSLEERYGQRMQYVYELVEGLKTYTDSGNASRIVKNVVLQILDQHSLPEADIKFLQRAIEGEDKIQQTPATGSSLIPSDIDDLLEIIILGLARSMYPLKNRRHGKSRIEFTDEYDIQDLFNSLLRPWVKDIRPEEYTPSYAGSSTRMDFLLYDHKIVCELKFVRDARHARKVGDELTIDIAHYRKHPDCKKLVAVIYDSKGLIANPDGLKTDIQSDSNELEVTVFIIPQQTSS